MLIFIAGDSEFGSQGSSDPRATERVEPVEQDRPAHIQKRPDGKKHLHLSLVLPEKTEAAWATMTHQL